MLGHTLDLFTHRVGEAASVKDVFHFRATGPSPASLPPSTHHHGLKDPKTKALLASAEGPSSPVTEDVPLTLSPTHGANTDGDSNLEQLGLRKPLRWENYKLWFALITVSSSFQPFKVHQLWCQRLVCGIAKNTTRRENPPNRR